MDPFFWSQSRTHHPAVLHNWKNHHTNGHLAHVLQHYLHYPATLANPYAQKDSSIKSLATGPEYYDMPATDIRTTATNYYFDLEVPGVTDKSTITVHWTSPWTFVVEGETIRPRILPQSPLAKAEGNGHVDPGYKPLARCPMSEEGDLEVKKKKTSDDEIEDLAAKITNGEVCSEAVAQKMSSLDPTTPWTEQDENNLEPEIVLGERLIGSYRRTFSIPTDVDIDVKGTEASLEAGVLTIRVPRKTHHIKYKLVRVPVV